jgi:branched-chain amino acid transport system ATP-binding protein
MLSVQGLGKAFGGIVAIENVTLDFPEGSLSAIIGPNGAGKTTFFNLISGAIVPDSGRVLLAGDDLVGLSAAQIVRRGITRAFQVASIFPSLTVEQSLLVAVHSQLGRAGVLGRRFPLRQTLIRAGEVMTMLGLAEHAGRLCANLSHGDQKLLDIALALVFRPQVLLLDEPTAGMGPEERWQMITKVDRLWQREKITVIFIEHDMDIVFKIAQSIRVLCYGKVLAQGTPDQIRGHPEVIAAYLGTRPEHAGS